MKQREPQDHEATALLAGQLVVLAVVAAFLLGMYLMK